MNLWCVGRNYADHAKELGNAIPTEPMIFLKAGSCRETKKEIEIPSWSTEMHNELEVAFEFGPDLNFKNMCLALDLTERAAQNKAKEKGNPWTLAKSFKGACPMTKSIPAKLENLKLKLWVNDILRQDGETNQMIFNPEVLRTHILERFPVEAGDWLLTGTPAGVGPIKPGDKLKAKLLSGDTELLSDEWIVIAK